MPTATRRRGKSAAVQDPVKEHDNDRLYKSPRGWRNAKRALGDERTILGNLMLQLEERVGTGCPRYALGMAIHAYLSMDMEACAVMIREYSDWADLWKRRGGKIAPTILRRELTPHQKAVNTIAPRLTVKALQTLDWIAGLKDEQARLTNEAKGESEAVEVAARQIGVGVGELHASFLEMFPAAAEGGAK